MMQPQSIVPQKRVAGYALKERLGSGSFATVYKGIKVTESPSPMFNNNTPQKPSSNSNELNAQITAVKVISRTSSKLTPKALSNLETEIAIMQKYSHENLVALMSVTKTDHHFYLFLEFCSGGDVQKLIRTRKTGRVSERLARRLMRDLTSGLKFLNSHQLIHRDIKPQNLLLTGHLPLDETCVDDEHKIPCEEQKRREANFPSSDFRLKIADFGFARHLQTTSLAETLCGSPLYMAPEILQHRRYDSKADLWSAGTVLFEMITGRPPFHGENHIDLLRNIQQKAVRLPPNVKISKECVALLRILLNRNPAGRATFEQFFEASNNFVGLGCNGNPPKEEGQVKAAQNTLYSRSNLGLNPIMEENCAQHNSASSSQNQGQEKIQSCNMKSNNNAMQICNMESGNSTKNCDIAMVQRSHTVTPPLESKKSPSAPPPIDDNDQANHEPNVPIHHQHHVLSRVHSKFAPLEASPPGPRHISGPLPIPPPICLNGMTSVNNVIPSYNHPRNNNNIYSKASHEMMEDSEFVLVDRNLNHTTSSIENGGPKNYYSNQNVYQEPQKRSAFAMLTRMTGVNVSNYSQVPSPTSTGHSNSPHLISSKFEKNTYSRQSMASGKGILSTSPSTGQALINMMGAAAAAASRGVSMTTFSTTSPSYIPPQTVATVNVEMHTKILSAAEDVGRRAMNVALLGDSRVIMAMKLSHNPIIYDHINKTSMVPLENMDDDTVSHNNDTDNDDLSMSSCRYPYNKSNAARRDSHSSIKRSSQIKSEPDTDDEMPFAMPLTMENNNSEAPPSECPTLQKRESDHINDEVDQQSIPDDLCIPFKICAHFREALSCYIKALSMLKGSVDASRQIIHDLEAMNKINLNGISSFKSRCNGSHSWLTTQFNAVLERADATNVEIEKILSIPASEVNSNHPFHSYVSSIANQRNCSSLSVEELIYNHFLAVGKDGAVKQLLGQYEAARSCYRSAGLLAETLLMEPKLGNEDRTLLEGYVQGFSDRINELDVKMLQEKRSQASGTTFSSCPGSDNSVSMPLSAPKGSGVIGLVGNLQSSMHP